MYKNLQEFPLLSFLAPQSLQVRSSTLVYEPRVPFYPSNGIHWLTKRNFHRGGGVVQRQSNLLLRSSKATRTYSYSRRR